MIIVNRHESNAWHEWRPGVKTRVWSAACLGARSMMINEQLFQPGTEAPRHWHYVEEHLTVESGTAEFWIDGETARVEGRATVIIPAALHHGFKNVGSGVLHIIGALAGPVHETFYESDPEGVVTRTYDVTLGGARRKLVPQLI